MSGRARVASRRAPSEAYPDLVDTQNDGSGAGPDRPPQRPSSPPIVRPPGSLYEASRSGAARPARAGAKARATAKRRGSSIFKPQRRGSGPVGPLGWLARLVAAGLAVPFDLALLGAGGAALVLAVAAAELPEVDELLEVKFEEPLRVYTAQGSLMAEFGVQRRRAVDYENIPPQLVNAFIAAEDSRFYDHPGIDIVGLARAALSVAKSGAPTQGGSTITMQLARNYYLTPEKTVQRKLDEILLAFEMESALPKERIMELYLNKIFFGHRAYGISAAAEFYYSKSLDELTLPEKAMLAGLPKAPSATNPLADPERARERRDYILGRMYELGYIGAPEYAAATDAPLTATAYVAPVEFRADYVAEMVRQAMVERYGRDGAYSMGLKVTTTIEEPLQQAADESLRAGLMAYNLRHGYHGPEDRLEDVTDLTPAALDEYLAARPSVPGLPVGVVTAADASSAEVYLGNGETETLKLWQVNWARPFKTENWRGAKPRRVTDAVSEGDVIRLRKDDDEHWILAQVPKVGGAMIALAPEDGAIRALSGGYAYSWSKFNRATDAERQPGSTFKPFVYAAALGKGYTPASLVEDEKFELRTSQGMWRPKNADGKYMGPIRMRVALAKSRNLAIINLVDRMSVGHAREFIPKFGFTPDSIPNDMAMALGSGSVTPLELARGFAVVANGGYLVEPYFIQRVEDVTGNVLFEADPPRACRECWLAEREGEAQTQPLGAADDPRPEPAVDPRIIYNMDSMLKDVIREGTATRARRLRRDDIAGKTGTTNESRDSWFAGYQAEIVAVAWMGRDDNKPLGRREWGGTAALGVWIDFMADALEDVPEADIKRPEGLVPVRIDLASGERKQSRSNSRIEYIRDEYQLMTLGPDPVEYSAPVASTKPKRTAPRVMDELF